MVEFLVVIAIAGILMATGMPALDRSLDTAAVASAAREFASALRQARAHALRRGGWVTVCARDPLPGTERCAPPGAARWAAGWLVFPDDARSGQPESATTTLRVQGPVPRIGVVDATLPALTFGAGGLSVGAASRYLFRSADGREAQLVCVSKSGRPRLAPAGRSSCSTGLE